MVGRGRSEFKATLPNQWAQWQRCRKRGQEDSRRRLLGGLPTFPIQGFGQVTTYLPFHAVFLLYLHFHDTSRTLIFTNKLREQTVLECFPILTLCTIISFNPHNGTWSTVWPDFTDTELSKYRNCTWNSYLMNGMQIFVFLYIATKDENCLPTCHVLENSFLTMNLTQLYFSGLASLSKKGILLVLFIYSFLH